MTFSSDVTPGIDITQSHMNNIRKDLLTGARIKQTVSPAAIVTLDLSNVTNGNIKEITLDQNITLRFSGVTQYPLFFLVRFIQDAGGANTVTIDQSGMRYPYGEALVVSDGANEETLVQFIAWSASAWSCLPAGFAMTVPA